MWTSADEYCEKKMQEEKNNNVEELQKRIALLEDVIKDKNNVIFEIKRAIDYTSLNDDGMNSWEIYCIKRKISEKVRDIEKNSKYL